MGTKRTEIIKTVEKWKMKRSSRLRLASFDISKYKCGVREWILRTN